MTGTGMHESGMVEAMGKHPLTFAADGITFALSVNADDTINASANGTPVFEVSEESLVRLTGERAGPGPLLVIRAYRQVLDLWWSDLPAGWDNPALWTVAYEGLRCSVPQRASVVMGDDAWRTLCDHPASVLFLAHGAALNITDVLYNTTWRAICESFASPGVRASHRVIAESRLRGELSDLRLR